MATLDVLTLEETDAALKGMRGAYDIEALPGLITAVSKLLDEECGPIVRRTVGPVTVPGGSAAIFLNAKVSGAVTVTEAWSSETPVAVLDTDFVVDDDGVGAILRKWTGRWAPRVTLTYTAGRFTTTDTVEEPFKRAAIMLLQHLWRRSDGGGSDTYGPPVGFTGSGLPSFTIPNVVSGILFGELLPPAVA